MAELMFGLGQTKKKKETEAKVKETKATLRNVNITETVETNELKALAAREKAAKEAQRETKAHLKDVNVTDSVEAQVRKEQHKMEKDWKEKGRNQKAENTNFDMARYVSMISKMLRNYHYFSKENTFYNPVSYLLRALFN